MLDYSWIFWYKLGHGRVSLFQMIDLKQSWKLTAVPVCQCQTAGWQCQPECQLGDCLQLHWQASARADLDQEAGRLPVAA